MQKVCLLLYLICFDDLMVSEGAVTVILNCLKYNYLKIVDR